MSYLFFDTETTGMPDNFDAPTTDTENWPRLVQIAWAHVSAPTDQPRSSGSVDRVLSYIVKPDGFEIPRAAQEIHGISTASAKRQGHPLDDVLDAFLNAVQASDALVAHNVSFDLPVVGAEFVRRRGTDPLDGTPTLCTKEESTDFCQIPNPSGYSGYKWPSLQELHETLFGSPFEEAHDAEVDVKAGANCFLALVEKGVMTPPRL